MLVLVDAVSTPTFPPLWRWTTKWGYFLGLAALIGSLIAHVAVVRPALRRHAEPAHHRAGTLAMYRVIGWGSLLMLVTGFLQSVSAVARAKKIDFTAAFAPGTYWDYHLAPAKPGAWLAPGWLSLAQVTLVVVCALLLVPLLRRREPSAAAERAITVALPLSIAVTLVKSLPVDAHATAWPDLTAKMLVQAHIIGGSAWAGGLVALLALTRSRHEVRAAAVDVWAAVWHRFGVVAMASVAAICVSGAWMTYREVGAPAQLVTTPFGIMLSVKIALVALLLVAGGVNQLVLMPRIVSARRAGDTRTAWDLAVHHLGRVVAAESVVVVLVILAAALLNGSAREQGGSPDAGPLTVQLVGWGLGALALMAVGLAATAKASDAIASRPAGPASAERPTRAGDPVGA